MVAGCHRTWRRLDLDRAVFKGHDPKKIARSLKRSAEQSRRRKATLLRSAMSMLAFHTNRAGSGLGTEQGALLERATDELRGLFNKPQKD